MMADFPQIEPRGRSYILTGKTFSQAETQDGQMVGYFHGYRSANRPIDLVFTFCTMATADTIRAHFRGEQTWKRFKIPVELLRTHPNLYTLTPANQDYRYREKPSASPVGGGLFDVTVMLETVF